MLSIDTACCLHLLRFRISDGLTDCSNHIYAFVASFKCAKWNRPLYHWLRHLYVICMSATGWAIRILLNGVTVYEAYSGYSSWIPAAEIQCLTNATYILFHLRLYWMQKTKIEKDYLNVCAELPNSLPWMSNHEQFVSNKSLFDSLWFENLKSSGSV